MEIHVKIFVSFFQVFNYRMIILHTLMLHISQL